MSLESLFDAVAALSVTTSDISPTVYNFDALPNRVDGEMLPARLLMPHQERDAQATTFEFISLGKTTKATRRLVDLLLLKSLGTTTSIKIPLEDLVQYCDAYETVARNNRGLASGAALVGMEIALGQFEYGDVIYFGAEVVLTIEDFTSG